MTEPQLQDRIRYLDRATRRIHNALDLDDTLHGLCRAAVPSLSDGILVHLREPTPLHEPPAGSTAPPVPLRLRRVDTAPGGPPGAGPAEWAPRECRPRRGGPLDTALRRSRTLGPVVIGRSGSPPVLALLDELYGAESAERLPAGTSVVAVPLRGRSTVLGLLVLLRWPGSPPFEQLDLLTAGHLATVAALGVDTAVRYGAEAQIADELQRNMLPAGLPEPAGVRLAHRYLAAGQTAHVGGDWYDAIPLPGNRVALVIGDVMGHSITSAAIMGQLRTTVQTLAGLDLPPHEVLHHLDEQAQRLGHEHMATCVYAVYDPIAGRLVLAEAGHVPPLLIAPDGRAEYLDLPPGAPIGVGGVAFESVEVPAPPGTRLLLYTDGLVESHTRDVRLGMELLAEGVAAADPEAAPGEVCERALSILGPGDRDDDIALLLAHCDGIPAENVAYWFLAPGPETPGRARRLARHALQRWGLDELRDSTELMVSLVVTNAVRYATRPLTLRLVRTETGGADSAFQRGGGVVRCEVGDDSPQLPRMRRPGPEDEAGRGLYLVSRMAQRWGATRLSTGKVVWFEQRVG
nr:ATP-binding SpoIIE family protein phosphatase [Phaeacidiphilus oryzae]